MLDPLGSDLPGPHALQPALGAELAEPRGGEARALLIVDDNAFARRIACAALEKSGYRVFEAGDGETAITLLAQHRPDLILLDLHLPDLNGVPLVSQLRAVPAGEAIPILAFSGLMSKMQRARALRAGYTDYVFKTAEPLDLVSLVDSYLPPPRIVGTQPGLGYRVLLVDDDPVQGRITARQMRECGFEVDVVSNGPAALASARSHAPHAIVVDLIMSGMNGMDLCLAVRRDADLARIPVVITSSTFSVIDDVDRQLAAEIAADSFVERTPSCAELIDKVIEVIAPTLPRVPGAHADEMSSEFVGRQIRQLKHQAWVNASLMQQAASNATLLSIMGGAAEILTREQDLPTLLHDVLTRALDASDVSAGAVFLFDERGQLTLLAQVGFPDRLLPTLERCFGERTLLQTLALGQRAVEIPSAAVAPVTAQALLTQAGATALIVAPLLTGGISRGALVLQASGEGFGEGLVTSVTAVACQLGQAVALSQTVERLSRSERRYRSLYEGIPTGVFRSEAGGRLLDFNPELVRLVGAPDRATLLDSSTLPLYLRPEDRLAWQAVVARDGEVRDFEARLRRVDGTTIWVAISARATLGVRRGVECYEGTLTDISQRKEAEAQLEAARSRLRDVLRSSDVVIYVLRLTPEGVDPEWVSENMARVTGHEGVNVMRFAWWLENVHPDDRDAARAFVAASPGPERATHEYRFRRADGTYMWVRDSQRLIAGSESGPPHIVGALVDITAQKALEAQLVQAQRLEAIGQLAAEVAHDFNNILTVVSGCAELLRDDLAADDLNQVNVTEISRAAAHASVLTRRLLAFGRRQVSHPVVLDLHEAIRSGQVMLDRLIGEHITIQVRQDAEPLPVEFDPGQLEQVLLNLAVNSRDAMRRGGTLTIETRRAELNAEDAHARALPRAGAYAMLVVADTGEGMSAEVQARAFEPLYTTKGPGKGTGLGLATVHGIVKQSGGSILMYSEVGIGTTLKLWFPLATEEPPLTDGAVPPPLRHGHGQVVLLVEDQDPVRRYTRELLVRHGYQVVEARNGEEAMRLAATTSVAIDLLLTDVIMPGMTGPELSDQLLAVHPNLPVIFLSGYAGDAVMRHGVQPSAINFLEKPFSAMRLLQIIESVLPGDAP